MLQLVKPAGAHVANKHRVKLNDRFIGDLQPRSKPFLIFDSEQVGLAVQVQPSGHRSFKCIYYRNSQTRWYHIGNTLAIKVVQARKLANEVMYQVAQDKGDPVADRKANRHAGTFEELAKQYAKYAEKKNKSWKATDKLIKRYVLPTWGKLRATEISRGDANTLMTGISARVTANQVMASTSAIFSWAIRKEIGGVKINPCQRFERNPTKQRERILSDSELPLFWKEFDSAGLIRSSALKCVLLLGQRPGEVAHMRTEHIIDGWWEMPGELIDGVWPGTKNDNSHRVWLPKPVLDIIAEIEPEPGFVFANSAGGAIDKLDAAMRDICKALSVSKKVTPQDLRRTHGSTVTRLAFGRDAMDRVQNHEDGRVRDVYDRYQYEAENKTIMEAVANKLLALIEGGGSDNVVAMVPQRVMPSR